MLAHPATLRIGQGISLPSKGTGPEAVPDGPEPELKNSILGLGWQVTLVGGSQKRFANEFLPGFGGFRVVFSPKIEILSEKK